MDAKITFLSLFLFFFFSPLFVTSFGHWPQHPYCACRRLQPTQQVRNDLNHSFSLAFYFQHFVEVALKATTATMTLAVAVRTQLATMSMLGPTGLKHIAKTVIHLVHKNTVQAIQIAMVLQQLGLEFKHPDSLWR